MGRFFRRRVIAEKRNCTETATTLTDLLSILLRLKYMYNPIGCHKHHLQLRFIIIWKANNRLAANLTHEIFYPNNFHTLTFLSHYLMKKHYNISNTFINDLYLKLFSIKGM